MDETKADSIVAADRYRGCLPRVAPLTRSMRRACSKLCTAGHYRHASEDFLQPCIAEDWSAVAAAVGAAQEVDSKAFAELWDEAGRRGLSGIGIDPKCLMQLHQALLSPLPLISFTNSKVNKTNNLKALKTRSSPLLHPVHQTRPTSAARCRRAGGWRDSDHACMQIVRPAALFSRSLGRAVPSFLPLGSAKRFLAQASFPAARRRKRSFRNLLNLSESQLGATPSLMYRSAITHWVEWIAAVPLSRRSVLSVGCYRMQR